MKNTALIQRILEVFKYETKHIQLVEIAGNLGIRSDSPDYDLLKRTLNDLVKQNILEKSSRRRYSSKAYDTSTTFTGILRIKNERGVVTPVALNADAEKPSQKEIVHNDFTLNKITIKRKHLSTALDGDTVAVRLFAERKGKKPQGEVTEIIKRNEKQITGTIEFDGYFHFLIPEEEAYYIDFLIPEKKLGGAEHGDKVSVKFLRWDDPQKSPEANVVKILGRAGEPKAEFDSILTEFNLPREFSEEIEKNAENLIKTVEEKVHAEKFKSRLDLRKELIVTIDPEDAKDFDDALSLKILGNGNYYLGVHIADVSQYVQEGSLVDLEAFVRGNSTYLVDRVVPMLPEQLSNEVCSLKPNRVRLAFSVMMEFTRTGLLKNYQIVESVIKSKKRFNYGEAQEILEKYKGKEPANETEKLLTRLDELAGILRKKRYSTGGIAFETSEIKFILDENRLPVGAVVKESTPATQLVEECMLSANKTIAEHIKKITETQYRGKALPFLYRVHDEPLEEKIKSVMNFVQLNYKTKARAKLTAKEINSYLKQFEGKPEKSIIHKMFVRSMPKAEYSDYNIGHYGLGFADYTHFTSPIRRYPDLVVHRLIKEYNKGKLPKIKIDEIKKTMNVIGKHCTECERQSMEAERASNKFASTMMAKKHLGKIFNGTITGVTNFGIFVMVDDIFSEGLVNVRDLLDDYYIFDEANFQLIGRRHNRRFYFGKRVKVQIINVNLDKRKVDLKYIET